MKIPSSAFTLGAARGRDLLVKRRLKESSMACSACAERRRKLALAMAERDAKEAAKQAILGAAEMVGLKKKPESDD